MGLGAAGSGRLGQRNLAGWAVGLAASVLASELSPTAGMRLRLCPVGLRVTTPGQISTRRIARPMLRERSATEAVSTSIGTFARSSTRIFGLRVTDTRMSRS